MVVIKNVSSFKKKSANTPTREKKLHFPIAREEKKRGACTEKERERERERET